jgi:3-methyladenine DNA glycosylase AlkC
MAFMAAPLKDLIGREVVATVANQFSAAWAGFDGRAFVARANRGLTSLELMDRARHVTAALEAQLPAGDDALGIFEDSLGPELEGEQMGPLSYFIHSAWLTARARTAGIDPALRAAEALTRRFTSEFVLRPLIARDPERCVAWLQAWAASDSHHVRRLVSEGTRPRLPWAPRLTVFEGAYAPLLELLDELRRDPSLYVRRSVANHLGDLAKDDLPLALDVARGWMATADEHTAWVVEHGLRHPLKQGNADALAIVGHGGDPAFDVRMALDRRRAVVGDTVVVEARLHNPHREVRRARADLAVDYVAKAGARRHKVFRLPDVELPAGDVVTLTHRLKMVVLSTRALYPGRHRVALKLNGVEVGEAAFTLDVMR